MPNYRSGSAWFQWVERTVPRAVSFICKTSKLYTSPHFTKVHLLVVCPQAGEETSTSVKCQDRPSVFVCSQAAGQIPVPFYTAGRPQQLPVTTQAARTARQHGRHHRLPLRVTGVLPRSHPCHRGLLLSAGQKSLVCIKSLLNGHLGLAATSLRLYFFLLTHSQN